MKKLLLALGAALILCGCQPQRDTAPKVVETQELTGELIKDYPSLVDLADDSQVVVAGITTRIKHFVSDNGMIWTAQTFYVTDLLSGHIKEDRFITIYRMGGSCTVKDYLSSFGENTQSGSAKRYQSYDPSDLIEQKFEYDHLPSVGIAEVCYLQRNTDWAADGYVRVGGYLGSYYGEKYDLKASDPPEKVKELPPIPGGGKFSGYLGEFRLDEFRDSVYVSQHKK